MLGRGTCIDSDQNGLISRKKHYTREGPYFGVRLEVLQMRQTKNASVLELVFPLFSLKIILEIVVKVLEYI